EIDYYSKTTTDLLLAVPVPGTSGFRTQTQNIGEIRNNGFEFVLNTNNLTGDFSWNTSINFAINQNEVISLSDGQDLIDPGSSRFMNVVQVGQPIGVFYGAEYAGVDPANGDALWFVNEMDGEGNIINPDATTNSFNDANFVPLGNPNPDFIYGITNNFSYKGVELSILLQGIEGNQIHNAAGGFMSCQGCWFDNQTVDQMEYWDQPGDITDVPEPRFFWGNGDQSRSSRYLADGSYLRVKNVTLAYTFPSSVTERLRIRSLRIYAIGQNVLTFTGYDGWDPEVTTDFASTNTRAGIDFYAAPQPKTFSFGVNLGL
ncbi:MAG: SusC/RagA family TonB-linked outer membrane protein, partial [Bacteroidota bacterium]